jgi:hypothetical protein
LPFDIEKEGLIASKPWTEKIDQFVAVIQIKRMELFLSRKSSYPGTV